MIAYLPPQLSKCKSEALSPSIVLLWCRVSSILRSGDFHELRTNMHYHLIMLPNHTGPKIHTRHWLIYATATSCLGIRHVCEQISSMSNLFDCHHAHACPFPWWSKVSHQFCYWISWRKRYQLTITSDTHTISTPWTLRIWLASRRVLTHTLQQARYSPYLIKLHLSQRYACFVSHQRDACNMMKPSLSILRAPA